MSRPEAVVEPRSNVIALRRRDGSGPSVQPSLPYDVELEPRGREPVILPPSRAQSMAQTVRNGIEAVRTPQLMHRDARDRLIVAVEAVVSYLMGDDE